jgi:hypothetical protein
MKGLQNNRYLDSFHSNQFKTEDKIFDIFDQNTECQLFIDERRQPKGIRYLSLFQK